jgi:hypothetical protein
MNMHMKNALPCGLVHIDSDIKAVRVKTFLQNGFAMVDHVPQILLFLIRQIKIVGYMPLGYD